MSFLKGRPFFRVRYHNRKVRIKMMLTLVCIWTPTTISAFSSNLSELWLNSYINGRVPCSTKTGFFLFVYLASSLSGGGGGDTTNSLHCAALGDFFSAKSTCAYHGASFELSCPLYTYRFHLHFSPGSSFVPWAVCVIAWETREE